MINDAVKNGYPLPAPVRESAPAASGIAAGPSPSKTTETPPTDTGAATAQTKQPDAGQIKEAVSKLNDYVQNIRRTLSFSIEESTGRTVIKVYDAETEELIRQIPPEETIRLAEIIDEQGSNLFIEERA